MFFGVFTTKENGSWNANISDVTPSSSLPSVSIAAVNCTSGSGHWWNFGRIQVARWLQSLTSEECQCGTESTSLDLT